MKKIAVLSTVMVILSLTFCSCANPAAPAKNAPASDEMLLGGWEIVPHEAEELPAEAQAAFDKASESLDDGEYTPVTLMATQVVAGTNYCILCEVAPNGSSQSKWSLVYIYADLQGNAEVMNVYDLYIAEHSMPKE